MIKILLRTINIFKTNYNKKIFLSKIQNNKFKLKTFKILNYYNNYKKFNKNMYK